MGGDCLPNLDVQELFFFLSGIPQGKARCLKGERILFKLVLFMSFFFRGNVGVWNGWMEVWLFESVSHCDSCRNGTHSNPPVPASKVFRLKPPGLYVPLHWSPHWGYSVVLAVWSF
jgi:hypothetical protein